MKHLDFDDVLIMPGESEKPLTRGTIDITPNGYVPIIVSNMVSTGTFEVSKIASEHGFLTFLSKEYTAEEYLKHLDQIDSQFVGITSGVRDFDHEKLLKILKVNNKFGYLNIDIANVGANVDGMIQTIELYKDNFEGKVVAGNVATIDLAYKLASAGADIIKVGIGSGAACTTRSEVGVGVPQYQAIKDITNELNVPIISDGGCVNSGDVCKAIAAGAEFVMLGGMFSSCKELAKHGEDYVDFFGLGSKKMYDTYTPTDYEYRPVEGRTLKVPVKNSIVDVFNQLKGALRSVCTYVGVDNIHDLSSKTKFIQVNHQYNRSLQKYE